LTFARAGQSIQAESEIHFRLVHNTLIVVSLFADQKEPIDFVFDTGADTTVVDPSILSRLSFVPLGQIQQTTLSSVQIVPRGLIRSLSVGLVRVDNVPVLLQDLTELHKMDPHIEGIAGQSFLAHFNYLIDYRKHLLRIEQAHEIRDAIDGTHVAIEAVENRMFVVTDARAFGRAKLSLVLDSGAGSVVLLRSASQTLRIPERETVLESTSSGQVGLKSGLIYDLTVGAKRFRNILAVLPTVEPREHFGDGLLPTVLFQTIYINNCERFVVFDPGIGHDPPNAQTGR
jgi:hypothetical protein